jgi:hypothetical protein
MGLTFDGYRIPMSLPWKLIQHWSKIFEKANLKMLRFKRSNDKLGKIKLQDLVLMIE